MSINYASSPQDSEACFSLQVLLIHFQVIRTLSTLSQTDAARSLRIA